MKEIFKLKAFWVVFVATAIVIFVAFLNLNKTYKSRTDVLVIPRSVPTVKNSDQIIANLAALPSSLSFYDRMNQDDPVTAILQIQELPAAKRLDYWDSKISVDRLGHSGILEITANDPKRAQAEVLSFQTAKELIATAGLYYNVQTDIDLRIIDGPITAYAGLRPVYVVLLESLAGSFILVTFAFFVSFLLFGEKEAPVSPKSVRWTFAGEKDFSPLPVATESLGREPAAGGLRKEKKEVKLESAPEKKEEEKPRPAAEAAYTAFARKAAAPANLPVAEEAPALSVPKSKDSHSVVFAEETRAEEKKEEAEPREEKPIIREATPEEVKERLNKLLSGKL